eukprot:CAMPEP_0176071850 /NCGR_PEP_ID=MMETSP0120_2-20121206/35889_1 /TAXON_ID=160619 /ORGANISM="Kryptoperidinium foliaceum, Strain CCMP 1326" /LENGTH=557 /DNA_ID=CAMNT_0017405511 /DNA_START=49 /DNA_END=1718 /DNA_ORIENTATION=-
MATAIALALGTTLLPVASAGTCANHSGVCTSQASEHLLLQRRGRLSRAAFSPVLQADAGGDDGGSTTNSSRHLPLCHHSIVSATCWRISGSGDGRIRRSRLGHFLSLDDADVEKLWSRLSLSSDADSVECGHLCKTAVESLRSGGSTLPTGSDLACYLLHGAAVCDIDVSPGGLIRRLATTKDVPLPDVVKIAPQNDSDAPIGLVQRSFSVESGVLRASEHRMSDASSAETQWWGGRRTGPPAGLPGRSGRVGHSSLYDLDEVMQRIANMFRIFPVAGRGVSVSSMGDSPSAEADDETAATASMVASMDVLAQAWVSTVLNEMEGWKTEPLRKEWFGGAGDMSASEVRDRLLRTMNFVQRELMDGIHYVYPAEKASDSPCSNGKAVAYVWKWTTDDQGYVETRGPVCGHGVDPFTTPCAVDPDGRYFVYLCRLWREGIDDNLKVATFVHEAAHHAGPKDVTYDRRLMKEKDQADQLNNAANFQNFAQDVVQTSWGCPDREEVVGLPYTCSGGPCTCRHFRDECDHARYGAKIREQCPATCGTCTPPTPAPAPDAGSP